jgi:hypothetical protein
MKNIASFAACALVAGLLHPARASSIAPFSLDLAQVGGPSAVSGTVLASGLNFPYGLTASANGSLLFGQSAPTTNSGLDYGLAPATTGSVWMLPASGGGSYGLPQQVATGLTGLVTSVQTLSNGALLVDSGAGGAGGAGTRQMSFYTPAGQSLGAIAFSYPPGSSFNWEHSNGMSLVVPNANGTDTVYFIVGSQYDNAATTATVSTSGLVSATLNADSVYMMTVSTAGGSVQVTGAPTQVVSGVRNPWGLSLDASGDLVVGDNGIDGAHVVDELGADTLHVVPAGQIGSQVFDFGFPNTYTVFSDGSYVNGDPNAVPPLVAFTPVADANGALQKSEGLSAMAYAAPGSLPFVGSEGGEFIGFHGVFDAGGAANYDNALLYYDFASGQYEPILDAGNSAVGHIDGLLVDGHALLLEEFSSTGEVNGLSGLGGGAIYDFDFSSDYAPEPSTWWLSIACVALLWWCPARKSATRGSACGGGRPPHEAAARAIPTLHADGAAAALHSIDRAGAEFRRRSVERPSLGLEHAHSALPVEHQQRIAQVARSARGDFEDLPGSPEECVGVGPRRKGAHELLIGSVREFFGGIQRFGDNQTRSRWLRSRRMACVRNWPTREIPMPRISAISRSPISSK